MDAIAGESQAHVDAEDRPQADVLRLRGARAARAVRDVVEGAPDPAAARRAIRREIEIAGLHRRIGNEEIVEALAGEKRGLRDGVGHGAAQPSGATIEQATDEARNTNALRRDANGKRLRNACE